MVFTKKLIVKITELKTNQTDWMYSTHGVRCACTVYNNVGSWTFRQLVSRCICLCVCQSFCQLLLSNARSAGSATGRLHAAVAVSIRPYIHFGLHSIPTLLSFRYLPHFSPFVALYFFSTVRRRILHIFCSLSMSFPFSFMRVIFRIWYTSCGSAWNKVTWQENKYKETVPPHSLLYSFSPFKWNPFGDYSCLSSRYH